VLLTDILTFCPVHYITVHHSTVLYITVKYSTVHYSSYSKVLSGCTPFIVLSQEGNCDTHRSVCHNPPLFHHTFCTSQKHSSWLYWFIPDTHNIYVSVKHNNLLHKIMPTAKYFESNESSSGHPRGLMQRYIIYWSAF